MASAVTPKYAATIAVVTCIPSGSRDSAFTLSSTSVRSSALSRRLWDSSSADSSIMSAPLFWSGRAARAEL